MTTLSSRRIIIVGSERRAEIAFRFVEVRLWGDWRVSGKSGLTICLERKDLSIYILSLNYGWIRTHSWIRSSQVKECRWNRDLKKNAKGWVTEITRAKDQMITRMSNNIKRKYCLHLDSVKTLWSFCSQRGSVHVGWVLHKSILVAMSSSWLDHLIFANRVVHSVTHKNIHHWEDALW